MAHDISKALAAFAERGITLSDEQQKQLADVLEVEFREVAEKAIAKKLIEKDEKKKVTASERWAKDLFALAGRMSKELEGKDRAQGRGHVHETVLNDIETPHGKLKVSLITLAESE